MPMYSQRIKEEPTGVGLGLGSVQVGWSQIEEIQLLEKKVGGRRKKKREQTEAGRVGKGVRFIERIRKKRKTFIQDHKKDHTHKMLTIYI